MGKPSHHRGVIAAACLAAALLCGCGGVTKSTLRIKVQGRDVTAMVRGRASISTSEAGDAAVITFAGKTVRVEQDRLLVDEVVRAEFPATAKRVDLVYIGKVLTVTADGAEVFKGEL